MERSMVLKNRVIVLVAMTVMVVLISLVMGLATGCAPRAQEDSASDARAGAEGDTSTVAFSAEDISNAKAAYALASKEESGTCETCHTSADALAASTSNSEIDTSLYLVNQAFSKTLHGSLGCVKCHDGNNAAEDATQAHAGMTARPTADGGAAACGTCHSDIVERAKTSLHRTTKGIECSYENRLSKSGEEGQNLGEEYFQTQGCPDCHADCGSCHVRNASLLVYGQDYTGLIDGHMFIDATDNEDITATCLACHAGSIAGCFTEHDVHGSTGAQMNCMDCHKEAEVHGDGTEYDTMIHSGALTTECEECHSENSLSGEWHSGTHFEGVECWACHNVEYNTCTNCHGWNAPERGDAPAVMADDCLIGRDSTTKKLTTLVKGPVDAEMLTDVGVTLNDEDLNTQSSLYPGFAHGIVKPTADQAFCDRCHGEGTDLLKEEELQFPDYETELLVGKLPDVSAETYAASR